MSIALRRMDFIVPVLLALRACAGTQVAAAPGVAETRLDGYIANSRQASIAWIDNESLLFVGAKPGVFEPPVPGGGRPFTRFLFRWNTRTGDVGTIAEQGEYGSICYDRGYVVYRARIEGRLIVREGLLGSDRTVPELLDPERYGRNPYSCREYSKVQFKELYGNIAQPLREDHGFWLFRRDSKSQSYVAFVSLVGGTRREIVTRISGPFFNPVWSEYAGAYVFARPQYVLDKKNPIPNKAWILQPSGDVIEIDVPPGIWLDASHGLQVVRGSYFLWSHNMTSRAGGGYLFSGEKIEQIISGYVHDLAVSPDGCRVAMSISGFEIEKFSKPEMTVLDVCSRR